MLSMMHAVHMFDQGQINAKVIVQSQNFLVNIEQWCYAIPCVFV